MATAKKLYVGVNGEAVDMASAKKLYVGYNNVAVEVPLGGETEFDYKTWLASASISATGYATLDSVLADEVAVRKLMTIHAAVDYLASWQTTDADIVKILNNDLCAKWITLRDYALDTLYRDYATLIDSIDKFFYGEWAKLSESPETWGPKGNVPIMTANNAPYGVASASSELTSSYAAYKAFDGTNDDNWSTSGNSGWIQFQFTNPVCVKEIGLSYSASKANEGDWALSGSNDGSSFTQIKAGIKNSTDGSELKTKTENSDYYLYYRLTATKPNFGTQYVQMKQIQFYGREMKVSVPVMTSNTAPYGEVIYPSTVSGYPAWKAFDGDVSTPGTGVNPDASSGAYIGYKFPSSVKIGMFAMKGSNSAATNTVKLQASDDGLTWDDTSHNTVATYNTVVTGYANADADGRYCRIYQVSATGANSFGFYYIQFWGFDYSEYDWDTVNPRHYLYDHSVELETFDTTTCKSSGSTITFNSNDIEVYVESGSNKYAFILSNALINLASYSNIFAKWGNKIVSAGSATDFSSLNVFSQKPTDYASVGTYRESYAFSNIPLTDVILSLDVSSVSQNKYIGIGGRTATSFTYRLDEWWLE